MVMRAETGDRGGGLGRHWSAASWHNSADGACTELAASTANSHQKASFCPIGTVLSTHTQRSMCAAPEPNNSTTGADPGAILDRPTRERSGEKSQSAGSVAPATFNFPDHSSRRTQTWPIRLLDETGFVWDCE